jgi:hypothetical protein
VCAFYFAFLIQWVGDEVEIVHGDASACVAVADSSTMDNYENLKCLTGLDLSDLKLIDSTKDGFATVVTFDMLFDKYSKQKAVTSDRPLKKG